MFLAWKEIWHSKGKFSLIISVVFLVSYLVYFLTSLAYGLASSYTNGVNKLQADEIVLTVDSNNNIMMSFMKNEDYDAITVDSGSKAKLGLFPAVIKDASATSTQDTREEIYVFGIENGSFIAPKETPSSGLLDNQVVADSSLKDSGYNVGDQLVVAGTTLTWEIVAFTDKATYQTAPILYTNLNTWKQLRYASVPFDVFSAVVVKGTVGSKGENLQVYTISEFIGTLPGYNAQVATFSIMIGFLIIIVAFVLGIFIYVLTIQKSSMFGVMKAQGISNFYIGNSVVSQTIIITGIGVALGLILTLVTGYFIGGFVPFAVNPLFYLGITLAFFLFSILGGLFSVGAVLKIDPLRAIG